MLPSDSIDFQDLIKKVLKIGKNICHGEGRYSVWQYDGCYGQLPPPQRLRKAPMLVTKAITASIGSFYVNINSKREDWLVS